MLDSGHCMMPFDNDEEFEIFYDFARAYKDCGFDLKTVNLAEKEHDMMEERKQASPKKDAKSDVSSDDWEDCDLEDETEDFEVVDKTDGTSSFDMINSTTSKGKTESESFTLLESKSGSKNVTEVIGDSHSSIKGDDYTGSVTSWRALNHQIKGQKRGKTRLEAF